MSRARRLGQYEVPRPEMTSNPRLYQAMELLAMPMPEFEARVHEEMAANPLLEIEEPEDEYEDQEAGEDEEEEEEEDDEIDWDDVLYDDVDGVSERGLQEASEYRSPVVAVARGLHDHLEDQVGLLRLDEREMAVAREVVGNIDDDGFLVCSVEEVAESASELFAEARRLAFSRLDGAEGPEAEAERDRLASFFAAAECEQVEAVLRVVQSLDPAGVGARDLPECLAIQLRRSGRAETLALQIVENRFQDFINRRWADISNALGAPLAEVEAAAGEIAKLDPKPGRQYDAEGDHYVLPDLIVEKVAGDYRVFANDAGLPRLRVARSYVEVARQGRLTGDNKAFVADRLDAANWFIHAISQRRQIMIALMEFILERQKGFFDEGVRHLGPLTMREAAEEVGVAESTISRATNGKYVQSPAGVHPLRDFFSGGFSTISGKSVSSRGVQARIKQLVEDEDQARPLTDAAIMALLKSEGIKIARRTVAKYRDALGIPTTRMRQRP